MTTLLERTRGEKKADRVQFPDGITAVEILEELQRMLASEIFTRSERLSRFLRFIVEKAIAGEGKLLNQYVIALDVFDKPTGFDPNVDPIIRVEAGRLRTKLREYHAVAGHHDPLRINLPKVGYCPAFTRQAESSRPPQGRIEQFDDQRSPARDSTPDIASNSNHEAYAASIAPPAPAAGKQPITIAVLPFARLSPDEDSHRLCDQIYKRVLHELVLTEGFLVRTGHRPPAAGIENIQSQKLSTELFLEGSLQRADGQVRIYAMLARSSDGCGIWADSYNRTLAGTASSEQDIARAIVESVVRAVHPPADAVSPVT